MKINKYIIKEERKGFGSKFKIMDEFENELCYISFGGFSGTMKSFEFEGSHYEVRKKSMFSYRHFIFKDGNSICNVGLKNGFSGKWLIEYPDKTIVMTSKMSFYNINFHIGNEDVAKASRKNKRFKTTIGLAVYDDVDAAVLIISLVNRLLQLRSSMAAV